MALSFVAIEGRVRTAQEKHNGQTITGFKLALFTNAAGNLTEASIASNLAQPTGGGYSPASLAKSGWTVDTATATVTRPNVEFAPAGSNYSAPITGVALLATYNSVDYLDGVQYFDVPRTVIVGGRLVIDMSTILG